MKYDKYYYYELALACLMLISMLFLIFKVTGIVTLGWGIMFFPTIVTVIAIILGFFIK